MITYPKRIMGADEIQLGDTLHSVHGVYEDRHFPFDWMVVEQVTETDIHLFRPYAITSDFSYVGNRVVPYIGVEQYTSPRNPDYKYFVYSREEKK